MQSVRGEQLNYAHLNLGSLPWRSDVVFSRLCTVDAVVLNRQLAVPYPNPAHATVENFGALPYPR